MKNRSASQCFILTLKLNTSKQQDCILDKRFRLAVLMQNRLIAHARKCLSAVRRDKEYREALRDYGQATVTGNETARRKAVAVLNRLHSQYGLSLGEFEKWIKIQQHIYKKDIDSNTSQKIAKRVWSAVSAVLYRKGKSVHFKVGNTVNSIEGKSNNAGIRFRDKRVEWLGLSICPQIRNGDRYARQALTHDVRYCRIVRKAMGKSYHYYVQLVLGGTPPKKHEFRADGRVGIDPGTSTEAIVSERGCILTEICPERKDISQKAAELQRHLDRSRRAGNPENYNPNGTVKPRSKRSRWRNSKAYLTAMMKLKTLRRRNADTVKCFERRLANTILTDHGTDIITEKMNYQALQRRAKNTSVIEKTGRSNSKKRFGASLARHAPARFLTILEQKLGYIQKTINYVNTANYKASQYDHSTDQYHPVGLGNRWKSIHGQPVQRDLYSAFLLMNAESPDHPDKSECIRTFQNFIKNHDACIERLHALKASGTKLPKSFGLG